MFYWIRTSTALFFISSVNEESNNKANYMVKSTKKENVVDKYKDKIYDYTNIKYITQRKSKYTHTRVNLTIRKII